MQDILTQLRRSLHDDADMMSAEDKLREIRRRLSDPKNPEPCAARPSHPVAATARRTKG